MDKPIFYQIRVQGHFDEMLASRFEGLTIANLEGGDVLLSGRLPDQAALQGVLKRISSLGLNLIAVNPVAGPQDSE